MRIVQINTVVGTGSVGRITASLYDIGMAAGMEMLVAYGRGNARAGMESYKIGSPLDMYSHVMRNFILGESGFGSVRKTQQFLKKLDEIKPDLIHLHNIHGFYLQIELLFSYIKEKKIPVIWTLHDCWPFTGHCAYFDYTGCEKWKTGCGNCKQHRRTYPYALLKDNSVRAFERKRKAFTGVQNLTIVTPSNWLAAFVKESFLGEYPVVVIPNGVDQTVFTVQERDTKDNRENPSILGVANIWEARKGLNYFKKLAYELPDNYHITLVGLNKKQIKELQADRRLAQMMTGIRKTESQQELAELYQKADVYVNTTLEDNFPTTNLEALSCGTPVITFDTGGSPEALSGSDTVGKVVKKGDVQALCEAVIQQTREKKPVQACAIQAQKYEKNTCFQKYIELYRRVLNES